jgi:DNA-binding transcriptional ArsR family regulator
VGDSEDSRTLPAVTRRKIDDYLKQAIMRGKMTLQTKEISASIDMPSAEEGRALIEAFIRISDPAKREEAMAIVKALADGEREAEA